MFGVLGEIRLFIKGCQPVGWLECDGSQQKIIDYPDLYDLLSNMPGLGETHSTFNLPILDCNGIQNNFNMVIHSIQDRIYRTISNNLDQLCREISAQFSMLKYNIDSNTEVSTIPNISSSSFLGTFLNNMSNFQHSHHDLAYYICTNFTQETATTILLKD